MRIKAADELKCLLCLLCLRWSTDGRDPGAATDLTGHHGCPDLMREPESLGYLSAIGEQR